MGANLISDKLRNQQQLDKETSISVYHYIKLQAKKLY